jgi:hypothetical protein
LSRWKQPSRWRQRRAPSFAGMPVLPQRPLSFAPLRRPVPGLEPWVPSGNRSMAPAATAPRCPGFRFRNDLRRNHAIRSGRGSIGRPCRGKTCRQTSWSEHEEAIMTPSPCWQAPRSVAWTPPLG